MHHLLDGDLNELGGVVRRRPLHALRQERLQIGHLVVDQLGRSHGVGGGCQLHGHGDGGLAVQARVEGVGFNAQLDAGHILDAHGGAVGVGAQHHVAELFRRAQLAGHDDGGAHGGAGDGRGIAQRATRNLLVLCGNGLVHRSNRQTVTLQLGRVHPHAHGAACSEQLRLAHAFQTLHFGQHVAVHIIGNVVTRGGTVRRLERQNHQEVAHRLVDAHTQCLHDGWQTRQRTRQAVLHVHLGQIGVGARLEGHGERALSASGRLGLHVHEAFGAVDFPLDKLQHRVGHGLGRGTRIGGRHRDGGRRNRRELCHRQLCDGHNTE
ncbi:hypothetical protein SDC9_127109 [bioreactor metagenome]|uniref:Uncharacterized protein n=1 Tax=bioreactor metagenome TaxID=1076179 RepID=A0A645CT21_9ZZZZ